MRRRKVEVGSNNNKSNKNRSNNYRSIFSTVPARVDGGLTKVPGQTPGPYSPVGTCTDTWSLLPSGGSKGPMDPLVEKGMG